MSAVFNVVLYGLWFAMLSNRIAAGLLGVSAVGFTVLLLWEIVLEPKFYARLDPLKGAEETAVFLEDRVELTTTTSKGQQIFTVPYANIKRFGVCGTTLVMVVNKKRNIVVDLLSSPEAHRLPSLLKARMP